MTRPTTERGTALRGAGIAFAGLAGATLILLVFSAMLNGTEFSTMTHPLRWLTRLDREEALGLLSDGAQVISGVLGIAITVVAIVLELAANRYSHEITRLFIHEPINIGVMSLYVLTTLLCVWVSGTLGVPALDALLPNAAFVLTMALVTASLLVMLPYFYFVFSFLSPLSIIEQLRGQAYGAIRKAVSDPTVSAQHLVSQTIDELQDVARSAMEHSDRAIAIASVNALAELVFQYETLRAELPARWFTFSDEIRRDPDFVSLAPSASDEIERNGMWVQYKVFQQYLSLMRHSVPAAHDVANLIAINTQRIGTRAAQDHAELISQCSRCFNSYLRITINANDARTSSYLFNQYRLLAEGLIDHGQLAAVREIGGYFRFYGVYAHTRGQSFLLEAVAHDLVLLIEKCVAAEVPLVDDLISLLLELDQEIKQESQEETLMGVRRAQIQIATLFIARNDEKRARRIAADLAGERLERLTRIRSSLMAETASQYWEFTPRGANFAYLDPGRRQHLQTLFTWLAPR